MISENTKIFLDSLSDEELALWLTTMYSQYEPIWEKCSRKEYEAHCGPVKHKKYEDWTQEDIDKMVLTLYNILDYKAVPVYKDAKSGLFEQIKLMDKEPDYYKYYKKKGFRKIIRVGSSLAEYLIQRSYKWKNK